MSFSAEWLALREPADRRARNADVLAAVRRHCRRPGRVRIADLGCGTGSTVRALAPLLSAGQHWTLLDHDASLLAIALGETLPEGSRLVAVQADLAGNLDAILPEAIDLLTCSALLDLVSDAWLDRLVSLLACRRTPFYAALTYDGRIALEPAHPLDPLVVAAVNRHQRGDKGFGPALGPDAAGRAAALFAAQGFTIVAGASNWQFLDTERDVCVMLLDGWAEAACEQLDRDGESEVAGQIADWQAWRRVALDAGRAKFLVGHLDLFAIPPV